MSKTTLILDSTQISLHYECNEKWNLVHNQNLILINKAAPSLTHHPGDPIAAGSLGHKYLELYYAALGAGISAEQAVRNALAINPDLEDIVDPQFPLSPELREKVRRRFCDYILYYPQDRDYKVALSRKPQILVDENDNLYDGWKYTPLVEQGFSYNLFESAEYLFVLEGKIDLIGETKDGTHLWMDHKFQFRSHDLYSKSIQFRNYCLALGLNLAVINYIRLHDKVGKDTFVRQPISFSNIEIKLWKESLIEKYIEIVKQKERGEFPLNYNSCGSKFSSYHCPFTSICEEGNINTKQAIIKRDFTQRKQWRPW